MTVGAETRQFGFSIFLCFIPSSHLAEVLALVVPRDSRQTFWKLPEQFPNPISRVKMPPNNTLGTSLLFTVTHLCLELVLLFNQSGIISASAFNSLQIMKNILPSLVPLTENSDPTYG